MVQEEDHYKKPLKIKKVFQKILGKKNIIIRKPKQENEGKFQSLISSFVSNQKEEIEDDDSFNFKDNSQIYDNIIDINTGMKNFSKKFKFKKKKKENFINSEICNILIEIIEEKKSINYGKNYVFNRIYSNIQFKIKCEIDINEIKFSLLNNSQSENYCELKLDFNKLKNILPKMNLNYVFKPFQCPSNFIKNFDNAIDFIIKFISVIKKENNYKFGISPNPIGLIFDKRIEFKINKNKCSIDIFQFDDVNNNNFVYRIFITSIINANKSFFIDLYSKNKIFDVENFLKKFTANLQEILKKENIENEILLNKNNLNNNNKCLISKFENNNFYFIFIKINCNDNNENIINNNENNICIKYYENTNFLNQKIYDNNKFYDYFGFKIDNFNELKIEEKNIIYNLISNLFEFKLEKQFNYNFDTNKFIFNFDLIKINNFNYIKIITQNKNEFFETVKLYLNENKNENIYNIILKLKLNEENFKFKIQNLGEFSYNENNFNLFENINKIFN